MAAATAVFAPASASTTARLLHRRRHNHSCGLAIARSPSTRASVTCRLRPALPSCRDYGRGGPLVPASDHWGNWTFLLSAAALGLWSEKRSPAGKSKALAGALVSVLLGMAASSAGAMAADAPAFCAALDYLLPLAVPLLLFRADLRHSRRSAAAPIRAFLLGSVATAIGTAVAFRLVPMRSVGPDSWKVAIALMSRHFGGAVSYVAVCEGIGVSPSVMEAGLAAGNAIRALYFAGLFALAAKIPAEDSRSTGEDSELPAARSAMAADDIDSNGLPAARSAMAVAAAFAICRAGVLATSKLGQLGIQGASLPFVTAIVAVAVATFFPSQIRKLAPSDDTLAVIVMQVLFAVVGANGSIAAAINTAPSIFAFVSVQVGVHLVVTLGVGKLLRFDGKLLLVASAANVGGLTSAGGVAAVKGWTSLVAPAILAGTLVTAIAASVGILSGTLFIYFYVANAMAKAGRVVVGVGGFVTFVGLGFGALAAKFIK
ncbi:unnamed protein product [Urochloa decumbens]|uniref:Uncharacterized protein n=2 Tax=Urochloa decumbens TaxID=240449 RepID=A0ABC9DLU8_9POAL